MDGRLTTVLLLIGIGLPFAGASRFGGALSTTRSIKSSRRDHRSHDSSITGRSNFGQSAGCDSTHILRVLFIGNSYTYVHNVPRLVEGIAATLHGPCIASTMIAVGGATLEMHWNADSVVRRIREGRWTHVVLNDQSTFGEAWMVDGRARVEGTGRELAEFARRFGEVIRGANAKPVLLAHWSDEDAPPRDQQALDYTFAKVARATGAVAAPGVATLWLTLTCTGVQW